MAVQKDDISGLSFLKGTSNLHFNISLSYNNDLFLPVGMRRMTDLPLRKRGGMHIKFFKQNC